MILLAYNYGCNRAPSPPPLPALGDSQAGQGLIEKGLPSRGAGREHAHLRDLNYLAHLQEAERIQYSILIPEGIRPEPQGILELNVPQTLDRTIATKGHLLFNRRTSYIQPRPVADEENESRDAVVLLDVSGSMRHFVKARYAHRALTPPEERNHCIRVLEKMVTEGLISSDSKEYTQKRAEGNSSCLHTLLQSTDRYNQLKLKRIIEGTVGIGENSNTFETISMPSVAAIAVSRYYLSKGGFVNGVLFNYRSYYTNFTTDINRLAKHFSVNPDGGTVLDARDLVRYIQQHRMKNRPLDIVLISDLEIENLHQIVNHTLQLAKFGRMYVVEAGGKTKGGVVTSYFGSNAYRSALHNFDDLYTFFKNFTQGQQGKP